MITLEQSGPVATLRYEPKRGVQISSLLIVALAVVLGVVALKERIGTRSLLDLPLSTLAVVVAAAGFAVGLVVMVLQPGVRRKISVFDSAAARIRIVTERSRGANEVSELAFEDVRELRLVDQKSRGSRQLTLTLIPKRGVWFNIAEERQGSFGEQPPMQLLAVVSELREATRLPGSEPLPKAMAMAGQLIGIKRI